MKLSRTSVITIAFFSLIAGVAEAGILYTISSLGLRSIQSDSGEAVNVLFATFVTVLMILVFLLSNLLVVRVEIRSVHEVVDRYRRKIIVMSFLDTQKGDDDRDADIHHLMGQVSSEALVFGQLSMEMYSAAVNLGAMFIVVAILDLSSVALIALVGGLSAMVIYPIRRRMFRISRDTLRQQRVATQSVDDVLRLGREVRLFRVEERVKILTLRALNDLINFQKNSAFTTRIVPIAYVGTGYVIVFFLVALISQTPSEVTGTFGLTGLVLIRSLSYGQRIQNGLVNRKRLSPLISLLESRSSSDDVFPSFHAPSGGINNSGVSTPAVKNETESQLSLRNISRTEGMSIPASSFTLVGSGLSVALTTGRLIHFPDFEVQKSTILGLRGPSGSGKTTFLRLIAGELPANSGTLQLDHGTYETVDDWRGAGKLAVVPQATNLLSGSLRENVLFFRDGTDQDILKALRDAQFLWGANNNADALNLFIGENGNRLSGGERQRISLARALLSLPDLLLMDEPTSALDKETEAAFLQSLVSRPDRPAIIVSTHDQEVLDFCDHVIDLGATIQDNTQNAD